MNTPDKFQRLLDTAHENCTSAFVADLRQLGTELLEAAKSEKLAQYDDGSYVTLDSYSGGASMHGAWGEVTLRFHSPTGSSSVRVYRALANEVDQVVANG